MNFTEVINHCKETGLYVGYVPGFTAPILKEKPWMN